ncbi:MAG: hypothetical protein K2X39_08320 [Silvanigrellaceae bacterium]|nr:hypothetical protein [Silvanigrellaceae bacterium]
MAGFGREYCSFGVALYCFIEIKKMIEDIQNSFERDPGWADTVRSILNVKNEFHLNIQECKPNLFYQATHFLSGQRECATNLLYQAIRFFKNEINEAYYLSNLKLCIYDNLIQRSPLDQTDFFLCQSKLLFVMKKLKLLGNFKNEEDFGMVLGSDNYSKVNFHILCERFMLQKSDVFDFLVEEGMPQYLCKISMNSENLFKLFFTAALLNYVRKMGLIVDNQSKKEFFQNFNNQLAVTLITNMLKKVSGNQTFSDTTFILDWHVDSYPPYAPNKEYSIIGLVWVNPAAPFRITAPAKNVTYERLTTANAPAIFQKYPHLNGIKRVR